MKQTEKKRQKNTNPHQKICKKVNILTKKIKKIIKENTKRQHMKQVNKLNKARKSNDFWKAADNIS